MGSKVDKEVSARAPFKLMCGFVFVFTLRSKSDLAGPALHFLFAKNCVTAIAIAFFRCAAYSVFRDVMSNSAVSPSSLSPIPNAFG